jgi:hypothetical protein
VSCLLSSGVESWDDQPDAVRSVTVLANIVDKWSVSAFTEDLVWEPRGGAVAMRSPSTSMRFPLNPPKRVSDHRIAVTTPDTPERSHGHPLSKGERII